MNLHSHSTSTPRFALFLLAVGLVVLALAPIDADAAGGPDITPPVLTGGLQRTILWPATNGLFPAGLSGGANDDCDGAIEVLVTVYSDEPNGGAPFTPDASGMTGIPQSFALRAERLFSMAGGNKGRAYVIALQAMDTAGNTSHLCLTSVCPLLPSGFFIMGSVMEAMAGVALCNANGGVIPPAMGWFPIFTFTLPPPIKATPDIYDCIGNCRLTVPDGPSDVLANDTGISPPFMITTAGSFLSANGGDVVLAADGSFTYDPPVGFSGPDTFTYGIQDSLMPVPRTATGTVTINVAEMIWFIDNTAGAGGDGRQASPFDELSDMGPAADAAGDVIYVDRGNGMTAPGYDDGLTLLMNQELYGEGVSLAGNVSFTIPPFNSLPGAGLRPVITNIAGIGVDTGPGAVIRGLDISAPTTDGIRNPGMNITVSDVTITNPGANGINFSSVNGTADLDNVDVTGAGASGFFLNNCNGNFDFDAACSASNSAIFNVSVSGGSCAVTYNGDLSQSGAGGLVRVNGSHNTGVILFQTGTVGCTSGSGIRLGPCSNTNTFSTAMSLTTSTDAIVLNGSTGTTNFPQLTISSSGDGLRSSGGGTINATNASNSIVATGGAAVDIVTSTLNMTFSSLTSTSGTNGIRLAGSVGSFKVTGLTDINTPTSGGLVVSTSPTIDIDFNTIDIDGGAANGISISGGVGDFDVTGQTTVDGTAGIGIGITMSGGDTFTFADTDVGLTTACDSGIDLTSSAGATFTFADLDITTSGGAGLVCDNAGTLNITGSPAINATGGAAIDITNTNGDVNGTGFTFASPVSTDSPDVGIRFDTTIEVILLQDVDIDSSSPMIDQGIEFTDCTGTTKTVSGGHVIFTATNDANGILVDNSDNVTIEGAPSSPWDPIGTSPTFTPNLMGGFEISGMGTGAALQTLNGNATGHHAINCHDSNGLIVRRCNIHDIGDLMNTDAHIDAGIFVDETTAGTVTVTSNYFADIAGSPCLLIGDPSSSFTGTSTFNFTFNRVQGDPDEPNAGSTVHNIQNAVQAALDSTSGATLIGNFDDNRIEGVSFTGIQVSLELNIASGNSGTGPGGRNLFSASRNYISDVDNEAVEFNLSDDSVSRVIVDDNTFDASNLHTAFDFGPQIAVDIQMNHGGATLTPILDLFIRNNTIESTNTGTQEWQDEGIRVETNSPSGAGIGVIRSLISDNVINHFEESGIRIDVDETNEINTIIRDNDIDSSLATPSSTTGIIDLDDQSSSDQEIMRAWIDGNDTGTPSSGVGYRIEEFEQGLGNPPPELACESPCTGLTVPSTITTNLDLVTLLNNNGNTANNGVAVTTLDVDTSAGDVDVVTTASIPAPTMLASAKAKRRIGTYLADKIVAKKLLEVAKERWLDAGISNSDASLLRSISLEITDLPGQALGKTWITHIMLDPTAAGHGWFIDTTPEDDKEFDEKSMAKKDGRAVGAMDLLTVLMHEIGHVIGREHCSCGKHLMSHELEPGTRHNPVK